MPTLTSGVFSRVRVSVGCVSVSVGCGRIRCGSAAAAIKKNNVLNVE